MSETQLLTVALTTVPTMIVILIGILINNARLTGVKETLHAEIKAVEANMDKNHSEMLHRVGERSQYESRLKWNRDLRERSTPKLPLQYQRGAANSGGSRPFQAALL